VQPAALLCHHQLVVVVCQGVTFQLRLPLLQVRPQQQRPRWRHLLLGCRLHSWLQQRWLQLAGCWLQRGA
jgi:hypothetical protein